VSPSTIIVAAAPDVEAVTRSSSEPCGSWSASGTAVGRNSKNRGVLKATDEATMTTTA